jgi:hypothetical protein
MASKAGKFLVVCGIVAACAGGVYADAANRLGAGFEWWFTVEDPGAQLVDRNGPAIVVNYQFQPVPLLKFEADVDFMKRYYGGYSAAVMAPQAYALLGDFLYGGVGIGILYSDGDWADNPFYAIRGGVDLPLMPHLHLDVNATYQFMNWDPVKYRDDSQKDFDTDVVKVGASVRYEF